MNRRNWGGSIDVVRGTTTASQDFELFDLRDLPPGPLAVKIWAEYLHDESVLAGAILWTLGDVCPITREANIHLSIGRGGTTTEAILDTGLGRTIQVQPCDYLRARLRVNTPTPWINGPMRVHWMISQGTLSATPQHHGLRTTFAAINVASNSGPLKIPRHAIALQVPRLFTSTQYQIDFLNWNGLQRVHRYVDVGGEATQKYLDWTFPIPHSAALYTVYNLDPGTQMEYEPSFVIDV